MHWMGKRIVSLLVLVFLLQLGASAYAEERKDEWKDKKYDFGNVKVVLFESSLGQEVKIDEFKQGILFDMISSKMIENESPRLAKVGWSVMTKENLIKKVEVFTGENMSELAKNDPVRYEELLKEYTAIYCTDILQVKITSFNETGYTVPERTVTYEEQKEVIAKKTVSTYDGKKYEVNETITVPVTKTRVIPAYYVKVGHAGMELTLVDTKTNQPHWRLVDMRDAMGKEPDSMLERIVNRSVDRLRDVKK